MIIALEAVGPNFLGEGLKSLITVGSALIVTTYVALVQFSHQSGKLSAIQSRVFFEYVFPLRNFFLGLVLLFLACAFTSDRASECQSMLSLALFLLACFVHGDVIVLMYEWSKGSQVSEAFDGEEIRAKLTRDFLDKTDKISPHQKAVLIVQHFKLAGGDASSADKKYAIGWITGTALKTYADYVGMLNLKIDDSKSKVTGECLRWLLVSAQQLSAYAADELTSWYSPDFIRSAVAATRRLPDEHEYEVWPVREYLMHLNRSVSKREPYQTLPYRDYFSALIEAAKEDFPESLTDLSRSRSLISREVMYGVFEAVGSLGYSFKVNPLRKALSHRDKSKFGFYVRGCFLEYVRDSRRSAKDEAIESSRVLFASHLEEVSRNHLLRLIRLEKDILNTNVESFMEEIARTSGGDGMMMLTNPPDDPSEMIEEIGRERRTEAEWFFFPFSQNARVKPWLEKMKLSLELRRASAQAKDDQKTIARVDASLRFLAEHVEFLEARAKG
jgi:hypothetical protein